MGAMFKFVKIIDTIFFSFYKLLNIWTELLQSYLVSKNCIELRRIEQYELPYLHYKNC